MFPYEGIFIGVLFLPVKPAFISFRLKKQVFSSEGLSFRPRRDFCHQGYYIGNLGIHRAFDDTLVMHMSTNTVVLELHHGVAEDVSGYGLDAV